MYGTCLVLALLLQQNALEGEWTRLSPLPDPTGLAGCFAGISHGVLLVAGGAQFPGKKPWEGGAKRWHDTIYRLDQPDGRWRQVGTLPRPLAYGISATFRDRVVCIGGSNAEQHYADCFQMEWRNNVLFTTGLPTLPTTLANACGVLLGSQLYVIGGIEQPNSTTASKKVWVIDLADLEPHWRSLPPCPGPGRMFANAAAGRGILWIAGGTDLFQSKEGLIQRKYLKDAYSYTPESGWKALANLPYPVVAAPAPAPTDATGFYLLGGDDGSQVNTPHDKHPGFRKEILKYESEQKRWLKCGLLTAPRVTAPCIIWQKSWIVPGGETHPGLRSPEVWRFQEKKLR